ncbi:hypothetical protein AYI70_g9822 [Smittium culicis]|uniref:ATP adenylyltransferase C-terminal domain-containing protein n=1 Tax=Smittium culicis TaxID=133412 RepID=A0A1R1X9H7_9FUNG|nr:hypothetical protein AYI70_g9822 [Smittium culicis]
MESRAVENALDDGSGGMKGWVKPAFYSYNFILTRAGMVLVPRSKRETEGIPINSLAFAGFLLCKSEEQVNLVHEAGVLDVLARSGFMKNSSHL